MSIERVKQWWHRAAQPHVNPETRFRLFVFGTVLSLVHLQLPVFFGEQFEMYAVARSLVTTGVFGNPLEAMPTGPTAGYPPIYPAFIALLLALTHSKYVTMIIAFHATALANTLCALGLLQISAEALRDTRPGIVAAVLWLLSVPVLPIWDASFTAAGLTWFTCYLLRLSRPNLRSAITAGLIAGLLMLLNASSAIVILPAAFFLPGRGPVLVRLRWAVGVLFVAFLTIAPWLVRNQKAVGAFVLRDNLGQALYVSFNDCAESSVPSMINSGCLDRFSPNLLPAEARRMHDLGEIAYDRLRFASTIAWIRQHSARSAALVWARVQDFWFPPSAPGSWPPWAAWIATGISLGGIVGLWRLNRWLLAYLVSVQMAFPILYYLVLSDFRYRIPIFWMTALLAGVALTPSPAKPQPVLSGAAGNDRSMPDTR